MAESVESVESVESEPLEWYTLLDGSHGFRGMRARKGGKILLTSKEAKRLGSRVVSTSAPKIVTSPATSSPVTSVLSSAPINLVSTTRDWSSTQDMKAPDVIDLINETDSKEELTSLQEVEEKGQNRVGVLNAIKKRMGQIG